MRTFLFILLLLIGVAAVAASFSIFIVEQTQQAIVLRFGDPRSEIKKPGLYFKVPFAETVEYFDKRILDLDTQPQEVIASDQKRLVVNSFARYRITNPLLFFQTVRDQRIANSRLGSILDSSLRRVLGAATFQDVVRDKRESLMAEIAKQFNAEADDFGVEIVDVRIKRADLPQANSDAIFRRMQTERAREAAEIRAGGEEIARRIRANADREVTVITAGATRDSERLRGEGEGERAGILASAFNKDEDFFAFYRSMEAYEKSFRAGDTRLVISPNSEFFRYFGTPEPGGNAASSRAETAIRGSGGARGEAAGIATGGAN
ncbi:MAG: protease modulator HflC [Rhizobiales bacterium]|nr:protease modulator HflC [Hyphomicrobiales bacterium]